MLCQCKSQPYAFWLIADGLTEAGYAGFLMLWQSQSKNAMHGQEFVVIRPGLNRTFEGLDRFFAVS